MPSPSPNPLSAAPASASPNASGASGVARPSLMKRQSSQSSNTSARQNNVTSPSSAGGEYQSLRHPVNVKPNRRSIVLPRNHNSARNLTKLNRHSQQQSADDGRRHSRQRSHEGDTEIKLPGSLDESRPPMKRNMTAYQLPRNMSNAKLKKNLSHGQLSRLGSGRNLAGLNSNSNRAPPSPGLKGKSKRPKSADITAMERDAHEREQQLYRQQSGEKQRRGSGKKVGFAVGSSGETSGDEITLQMEGSGLQEDEWTEESASASPYSTRQNTANNSRRASMNMEKAAEKMTPAHLLAAKVSEGVHKKVSKQKSSGLKHEDSSSEEEPYSPRALSRVRGTGSRPSSQVSQPPASTTPVQTPQDPTQQVSRQDFQQASSQQSSSHPSAKIEQPRPSMLAEHSSPQRLPPAAQAPHQTPATVPQPPSTRDTPKDPPHQRSISSSIVGKDYVNPAARRLMSRSSQLVGSAVVSNVTTLDDRHSNRGSPAPSLRSTRSNNGEGVNDFEQDELVSRFVPSASHPSVGSGADTALNTPKQSGFHTPEQGHLFPADQREKPTFQAGPVSPGSTVSGSSGATTPAVGRSRTELRLMQEKALADLESRTDTKPYLPGHVYDRRNESLKSFMSAANLMDGRATPNSGLAIGPQIFQGRFRAVNTELRVVQKFRDPLGEAVSRLRGCKGSRLNQRPAAAKTPMPGIAMSKSTTSLPSSHKNYNLSKSASPPKTSSPLKRQSGGAVQLGGGSERHKSSRGVSFAGGPPEMKEIPPSTNANGVDPAEVLSALWYEYDQH